MALSEQGDIFTWGRGSMGHLGNKTENSEVFLTESHSIFRRSSEKLKRPNNLLAKSRTYSLMPKMKYFCVIF